MRDPWQCKQVDSSTSSELLLLVSAVWSRQFSILASLYSMVQHNNNNNNQKGGSLQEMDCVDGGRLYEM